MQLLRRASRPHLLSLRSKPLRSLATLKRLLRIDVRRLGAQADIAVCRAQRESAAPIKSAPVKAGAL
jgi:hypothetical protein